MRTAFKAAIAVAVVAVLLAVGWRFYPHKVGSLLASLLSAFSVDTGAFIISVVPWAAAALTAFALKESKIRRVRRLADTVFFFVVAASPIIACADLMGQIYTTTISQALEKSNDFEAPLGSWRFMLVFLLWALAIRSWAYEKSRWNVFETVKNHWRVWAFAMAIVLSQCALFMMGGYALSAASLSAKPSVEDNWGWIAGRYIGLGGAFTLASFVRFFSHFSVAVAAEPWFALAPITVFIATTYLISRLAIDGPDAVETFIVARNPRPVHPGPTGLYKKGSHIYASVNLFDLRRKRFSSADLIVDPSFSVTVIPENVLKQLKIKPIRKAKFEDFREEKKVGSVIIEFQGREAVAQVVFGNVSYWSVLGLPEIQRMGIMEYIAAMRQAGPQITEVKTEPVEHGVQKQEQMEEEPSVGIPVCFQYFTASDGGLAREAANRKGLVALCCGEAKWDPAGRKYEFLAIPEELGRRILSGGVITQEEKRDLARFIQGGEVRIGGEGGAVRVTAVSEGLKRDLERQISRIVRLKNVVSYVV